MKLITWNVQWCRGMDARVSPARIVEAARAMGDFDVLCLQEVADCYAEPRLAGSRGEDQFAEIARLLPGFAAVPGVAVDVPAESFRRRRFGNLVLSRLPVGQVFRHLLPFPLDPGVPGMPRVAVEAVVRASFGDVRIITTHLEYYGVKRRTAQVEAVRALYAEGAAYGASAGSVADPAQGPFESFARPAAAILCGDFNLEPGDPLHARMVEDFGDGTPPLRDAWQLLHADAPHPPTFKAHADVSEGPALHCDFVFVSADMQERVRAIEVDAETTASDHQPILVAIE